MRYRPAGPHSGRPRRVGGFTLVEISVAAFVLVLFVGGLYKIFSTISRSHAMGSWINATTVQLRNGLNLLRQDISRATPPTLVTQQGGVDFGTPEYRSLYMHPPAPLSSTVFPRPDTSPDVAVLKFFMCQPGRKDIVGEEDMEPEIIQGLLKISKNALTYSRSVISQAPGIASKTPIISQVICPNLHRIQVEMLDPNTAGADGLQIDDRGTTPEGADKSLEADQLSVKKRNFLRLLVTAVHPRYADTRVEETIDVAFEVPVVEGGLLFE